MGSNLGFQKLGIFLKSVLFLFCTSLLFSTATSFAAEEDDHANEIAMLEPNLLTQQPLTLRDEVDLSTPVFTPTPHKNSFLAVSLSALAPGLGHVYLGEYKTASYLLGSSGLFAGLYSSNFFNQTVQQSNYLTLQNIGLYSIYAAYRDVRIYNCQEGYSYKMPQESFTDLAFAPFQWSVIKKPEVWGGFLGALTVAAGVQYFLAGKTKCHVDRSKAEIFPLVAFPIGIGEESFFRGYLQSTLSEAFTPWGGITTSSLAFGAAHIPNAEILERDERWRYYSFSLPFITSFGVYLGWLTYKNHSLKEGVALHAWYDFALFLASYAAAQSAAIGTPSFSISINF